MFRGVVYLLISLFVLMVVRMMMGVIFKGFGEMLQPQSPVAGGPTPPPAGGDLKRDPVCGTFVPVASSLSKNVGGQVHYFCSDACRDKFA